MSRSDPAAWAWSAAKRPAPPEPRIRRSVLIRSIVIGSALSEDPDQESEGHDGRHHDCRKGEPPLPVAPREVLDEQQAKPAKQMDDDQEHEAALGELDRRHVRPAQEPIESRLPID